MKLRRLLGISWTAVAALVVFAPAAAATSCVMHPDASAASILAGEEQLALDGGFDAHYRGAVLGTVEDVDTDEREGSRTYGRTVVRMDVLGTHGDVAAGELHYEMVDPGWMSGYPFETGTTYFVPVPIEPNTVVLCDPISAVTPAEVDALVGQLDPPADDAVLVVGSDRIAIETAAVGGETADGGVPGWLWLAVAAVLVVGAVGVTALIGRDHR